MTFENILNFNLLSRIFCRSSITKFTYLIINWLGQTVFYRIFPLYTFFALIDVKFSALEGPSAHCEQWSMQKHVPEGRSPRIHTGHFPLCWPRGWRSRFVPRGLWRAITSARQRRPLLSRRHHFVGHWMCRSEFARRLH